MHYKNLTFIAILLSSIFMSCQKEEGQGGKISIKGKLIQQNYSSDFQKLNSYAAAEKDVYITFGDDLVPGDDVETGPDGAFEFNYLYPGSYTIFAYSDDITGTSNSGDTIVSITLDVKKSDDEVDAGNLVFNKIVDADDGNAVITGRLYQINYFKGTLTINDTTFAQNEEVFLVQGDKPGYDLRVRTGYDGRFIFNEIVTGDFKVFAYSESLTYGVQDDVVIKPVTVESQFETVNLGDIYVIRY